MSNQQLQELILADLQSSQKPLDKEGAMVLVRERLRDYPRQLQYFGDWFEKNYATVLERING